jgi:hypothetical protein
VGETKTDTGCVKYFYGTVQEFNNARMACMERGGVIVTPGNPDDYPGFSSEGVTLDRWYELDALCSAEIGEFYVPPATEASMTAQYEWEMGQYRCLVKAGFQMEDLMSLDAFLDEWRRVGYVIWHDPIQLAVDGGASSVEALHACPRTTETWPDE